MTEILFSIMINLWYLVCILVMISVLSGILYNVFNSFFTSNNDKNTSNKSIKQNTFTDPDKIYTQADLDKHAVDVVKALRKTYSNNEIRSEIKND
jgi:hypothetical protein